jgi:hypothetical protein
MKKLHSAKAFHIPSTFKETNGSHACTLCDINKYGITVAEISNASCLNGRGCTPPLLQSAHAENLHRAKTRAKACTGRKPAPGESRTGRKPAPGENLHRAKSYILKVFAGKKIQNRPENIKIAPTPDSPGRKRQAKTCTGRKSENRGNSRANTVQYRNLRTTQAERERRGQCLAGEGEKQHCAHAASSILSACVWIHLFCLAAECFVRLGCL